MKALQVALAMVLSLGTALGHTEPAAEALAQRPGDSGDALDENQAHSQSDPSPINVVPEPRGELVRLSQLPEAELMVDVSITSNDERAYFEVNSDKTGASLLICGAPCRFRIWPGRYRLITNASGSYVGGSNQFVVERNSKVQITEPPTYRPALGAFVGSLGIVSAVIGGMLLATSPCGSRCDQGTATFSQIGFLTLGAGLVLAPVGWVLFGQNRNPDLSINPDQPEKRQ